MFWLWPAPGGGVALRAVPPPCGACGLRPWNGEAVRFPLPGSWQDSEARHQHHPLSFELPLWEPVGVAPGPGPAPWVVWYRSLGPLRPLLVDLALARSALVRAGGILARHQRRCMDARCVPGSGVWGPPRLASAWVRSGSLQCSSRYRRRLSTTFRRSSACLARVFWRAVLALAGGTVFPWTPSGVGVSLYALARACSLAALQDPPAVCLRLLRRFPRLRPLLPGPARWLRVPQPDRVP